jgi:hypothetical protein
MATELAECYTTPCYVLRGILLVPHYTRAGIFVGPGHRESDREPERNRDVSFTEAKLQALGARPRLEFLWRRAALRAQQYQAPTDETA